MGKKVDDTAEAFGMRMGPLAMSDMVGLVIFTSRGVGRRWVASGLH